MELVEILCEELLGLEGVFTEEVASLKKDLQSLCGELTNGIELATRARREETATRSLKRVIKRYLVEHRESASVVDLQRFARRLEADGELLGDQR